MNWIALFSHTGSEIRKLSDKLGKKPDKVITNLGIDNEQIDQQLMADHNVYYVRSTPSVSDYNRLFTRGDFVTLHGWMRIIPPEVCDEVEIYNLHPGLITKYPELKGKDPQSRVFNQEYTYTDVGCVLHRVIPEVDAGEVIMERSTFNKFNGETDLTVSLHEIAGSMWYDFLSYRLKGDAGVYFN